MKVKMPDRGYVPVALSLMVLFAYTVGVLSQERLVKEVVNLTRVVVPRPSLERYSGVSGAAPKGLNMVATETQEEIHQKIKGLAKKYTEPFSKTGISRDQYLIRDKVIHVYDPRKVHTKGGEPQFRLREALFWMKHAVVGGTLDNTEIVLSLDDMPVTTSRKHAFAMPEPEPPVPIFSHMKCSFTDQLPFPMTFSGLLRDRFPEKFRDQKGIGLLKWDDQMLEIMAADHTAWTEKIPRAAYRGKVEPGLRFLNVDNLNEQCEKFGSSAVFYVAAKNKDVMDVDVEGTCGTATFTKRDLSWDSVQNFKYVLSVEGASLWPETLPLDMFSSGVVLKQDCPCHSYFEPILKPFQHYLPFKNSSEIPPLVRWAEKAEDMEEVVKNSIEFGRSFLSLRSVVSYVEAILEEYSNLLVSRDITIVADAIQYYPLEK